MDYLGKRSTWKHTKRLLTVTYIASIIKLLEFYLNKTLFQFGKTQSLLCSFCHSEAETTLHVFHKCSVTKIVWNQGLFFETGLDFPDLTPQAALFGFISELDNNLNILHNLILLIFKLYIYQSRERGVLNLNILIKTLLKS